MTTSAAAAPDPSDANKWDLHKPGARRSLLLLAFGAVVGLGVAGFGLFTAKGTASHTVPPEMAALVNQQPILISDFTTQLQSEFGIPLSKATPAQRRKVLNDMINEELMVQRGQEMNLAASDPDVRSALVAGVELQNSANIIAKQPTHDEMLAYYNSHKDRYRTQGVLTLRDLMLPAGPQAAATMAEVAKALKSGASVDAVKSRYRLTETNKVNGEELDFAAKIHLGETLYRAVQDSEPGQIIDPVVDRDGSVHVMTIGKRTPSVQLTFDQASNQVFTDFKKDAQDAVQAANIKYLRDKSEIMIQEGYRP
jgi:hypothetical protein